MDTPLIRTLSVAPPCLCYWGLTVYHLKLSPEKKIEVYILMLLYFFMGKKRIPDGDSYIEVRVGCSSSCLGVEIAVFSLT